MTFEGSHWELLCKKGILRCAFAKEFEVLWIVKSWGTLTKLGPLRSSHRRCSVRKCIFRNFAKLTGKHLCRVSCRPQACNFIKIETLARVFSCEFCEISKNTFFLEHIWATASMLFETLPFGVGY